MTAYLDEYNPYSKQANYGIQSDINRLKYNNIQSCIAVAIYPTASGQLVGVHLTTATTGNQSELKNVCKELKTAGTIPISQAYLVANYKTHHAATLLSKELKKIVSRVWVCDIPPVSQTNTGADVDVKIELSGNRPLCWVRSHASLKFDRNKVKPEGGFKPGQPHYESDKADRPWMMVAFLPV